MKMPSAWARVTSIVALCSLLLGIACTAGSNSPAAWGLDGGSSGNASAGIGDASAASASDSGGHAVDGEAGPARSPDGPLKIVSLTTTVSAITSPVKKAVSDASSVTFVAIVTDEAGVDAIVGGTLTDETGATYGAFDSGAQKGTFTATVSWDQATQVRNLTFSAPGTTRNFTAKFFDNKGQTAAAPIDITFYCGASRDGDACSGTCTSLPRSWDNCGSCGKHCGGTQLCYLGGCIDEPVCFAPSSFPVITSCVDYCKREGLDCNTAYSYDDAKCDEAFAYDIHCTGSFPPGSPINCNCW